MNRLKGQRGLSLVEVTIMLLVLMLLTSVLAPSIFDFVNDARWVKVKEDCEAIGITIARITRDVGPCLKFTGNGPCTLQNRVEILYSDGPDTVNADLAGSAAADYTSNNIAPANINWDNDSQANVGDSMEDQFTTNAPLYNTPAQNYPAPAYPVGPLFGIGWRGAYLAPPIGPDPWGQRYLVNSVFLAVATNANDSTAEGYKTRWWERDVFCISPGPNGLYETFFGGCTTDHGTCREGDDFVYVVSGSGR